MLILYHNSQEIVLDNTEYYVRELASGLDEIIFDISIWDPNYALMNEEDNIVDRGGQRYLIKQIDAGAVTAKIVAQLDLDEWKATLAVGYNSGTKTVAQQIDAVKPTGWSVMDYSGVSIGRTISGDLTPLQVCEECRDTYQVYIRWDNKAKKCNIYKQALGSPVGSFASRELNLKEINYKGKSQNFATRLYAYGKDGLSFADINSGKPYVDDNTYSNRVICAYWQDDRYTVKANLLADAQEKLAKLAVPERSYDCAIVDLQATNPAIYNNLDFSLFTTATLIDDIKGTAIDYMVVERHVWPYHPDRNDVIFNSAPIKIQNSVIQIEDEITNPNSTFSQIWSARVDEATEWLTSGDGYVVARQDANGNWKALLFMDTPDIATAQKVIQINENGIGFSTTGANGPYTNAWTIDGKLNADFILTGHLIADRIQGGTLESINSTSVGGVNKKNFSLNMTTGALEALKLSITSPNFTLTEGGDMTATNGSFTGNINAGSAITGATITGGSVTSTDAGGTSWIKMENGQLTTHSGLEVGAWGMYSGDGSSVRFENYGVVFIDADGGDGEFKISAATISVEDSNTWYSGVSGSFYDNNGNQITVHNGIITSLS